MSELKPCKMCGGKVDWCRGVYDCKGCHLIMCESCKSEFDLSQCDGVRGGSLQMMRSDIAGIYNNRVPMNCDLRADVLALCDQAYNFESTPDDFKQDDIKQFAALAKRISERLRGSDAK